jgi:hypothetical protein
MTLLASILAVLMVLPPAESDVSEPTAHRWARLADTAEAIAIASERACGPEARKPIWLGDPPHLAARLVALGWGESRYARYVGAGRCLDGPLGSQCDPHPRTGEPRARSYWQLWRVAAPEVWYLPAGGPRELRAAAWAAARRLSGARTRCRGRGVSEFAGAYAGYRALPCRWAPAIGRAAHAERIERQIRGFAGPRG